jgi:hypothetical protein
MVPQVYETKEIIFDSFAYSPKTSDLINYGSLRFVKSKKKKNTYTLRGNYTIKRELGNEKLVTFELFTRTGGLLTRRTYAFCEFTRTETMIWPDLVKRSNMPQDNPCPFPEVRLSFLPFSCQDINFFFQGNYTISKYTLNESKMPKGIPTGKYLSKIHIMEFGKTILNFDINITVKK